MFSATFTLATLLAGCASKSATPPLRLALAKIDTAKLEVASRMPVGASSFFFAIRNGQDFPATEY